MVKVASSCLTVRLSPSITCTSGTVATGAGSHIHAANAKPPSRISASIDRKRRRHRNRVKERRRVIRIDWRARRGLASVKNRLTMRKKHVQNGPNLFRGRKPNGSRYRACSLNWGKQETKKRGKPA